MVGWKGNSRWEGIDIFNLLGLDPITTTLSWPITNTRPRRIIPKLKPNDCTVELPEGVSIELINAFRSDMFDLLHPTKQGADDNLFQTEPTVDSTNAVANALAEINKAGLVNYRKTWDPEIGVPGNWLGFASHVVYGDVSTGGGGGGDTPNVHADTASPGTSANTAIVLAEDGTPNDPITLDDDNPESSIQVPAMDLGSSILPLFQQERYTQLVVRNPRTFNYVMAPSRLRALTQRFTNNNKAAMVIGMVRRPDWDAAQTFPEYVCIAALNGNSMTIRVYKKGLQGDNLPAWPGGGTVFVTVDDIKTRGYLFRAFHGFDKDRIKRYLMRLRENDALPRIRSSALVVRADRP